MEFFAFAGFSTVLMAAFFAFVWHIGRCEHRWTVKLRSVVPPVALDSIKWGGQADEAMLTRLLAAAQGGTTVLLTCSRCGRISERTLLGNADVVETSSDEGKSPSAANATPKDA